MSIKEKVGYFWKVTLGPDYQEVKIDNQELQESLKRVENIESEFMAKIKKGRKKVVDSVAVDAIKGVKQKGKVQDVQKDNEELVK